MDTSRRKKRFGPTPRPLKELKLHQVVVRFDAAGLSELDSLRGDIARAVWLRDAGLKKGQRPPAPVFPEVNKEIWAELARGPMSLMHQIKHEADRLQLAHPEEDMRWKKLGEHFDELIQIAHELRAGLLAVIPNARGRRDR